MSNAAPTSAVAAQLCAHPQNAGRGVHERREARDGVERRGAADERQVAFNRRRGIQIHRGELGHRRHREHMCLVSKFGHLDAARNDDERHGKRNPYKGDHGWLTSVQMSTDDSTAPAQRATTRKSSRIRNARENLCSEVEAHRENRQRDEPRREMMRIHHVEVAIHDRAAVDNQFGHVAGFKNDGAAGQDSGNSAQPLKHDFPLQDSGGDHPEDRDSVVAESERYSREDEYRAHQREQFECDAAPPAGRWGLRRLSACGVAGEGWTHIPGGRTYFAWIVSRARLAESGHCRLQAEYGLVVLLKRQIHFGRARQTSL